MTLRDILNFLFSRKTTIFGVFFLVITVTTLLTYSKSEVYKAQAAVIVERNRAPAMRSTYVPGLDILEAMNTEAAIVKSRAVMENVVDTLRPHERPRRSSLANRVRQSFKNALISLGLGSAVSPRDKWIEVLSKAVKARPGTASNVLYIEYQEDDPVWAQQIANAVTDAYIAHHLKVFSSQGLSSFYQQQIDETAANLKTLRDQLIRYRRSVSVAAAEEAQRASLAELGALRDRLAEARTRLAELESLFAPGHEQIRSQEVQIRELEALEEATKATLIELADASGEIARLQSQIEAQEKTFRTLRQEYDGALLAERTNSDLVNVRLVDYAPLPLRPVHSRLFYIGLSGIGGLILGVLLAFIRAYFDRRVTAVEELEDILGLPSLGAVEHIPRGLARP